MSSINSPKILGEGQYLRLVAADGWEWAERHNCTNAVIVVPITRQGELVLIEQYRIPLGRDVLGLPAGLVGDEEDGDEAPLVAARRELHEETGFEATQWRRVLSGPSSPRADRRVVRTLRGHRRAEDGARAGAMIVSKSAFT